MGEHESQVRELYEELLTAWNEWKAKGVRRGMVPPGAEDLKAELNAVQSLLAVQEDEGWRVALFQHTPAQYHGRPDLAEQHTAELRQVLSASGLWPRAAVPDQNGRSVPAPAQ